MSGLFPKPPKIKAPPPPVRMPDPEDQQAMKASRLQQEKMRQRGGREGTILSNDGAGDYSKKSLG